MHTTAQMQAVGHTGRSQGGGGGHRDLDYRVVSKKDLLTRFLKQDAFWVIKKSFFTFWYKSAKKTTKKYVKILIMFHLNGKICKQK